MIPDLPEVCPMPLERGMADLVVNHGKHGDVIPMDWLTRNFRVDRRSSQFNNRMHKLRRLLAEKGFSLSLAGLGGAGYRILGKMETLEFVAVRDLRRAEQTLADARMLNAISGDDLTPNDRAKLEHSQQKAMALYVNTISIINRKTLPPPKPVEPMP